MYKKRLIYLGLFVFSILISSVSASVSCSTNTISSTFNEGATQSPFSISCTNNGNSSVSVFKSGTFFTTDKTDPFTIGAGVTTSFQLTLGNLNYGNYAGSLSFSDSSSPIQVSAIVNQATSPSDIVVFPTSKVITVKQGDEKSQSILISVPQSYPRTITINSVDFNPSVETIKFGDLNLGQVSPGSSISIPILFSGKNAETGSYSTTLKIFATDSLGQINLPSVTLQLQLTQGITPVTNETFNTKPSCTLSDTQMNINGTYTFTCTGLSNNIDVSPQYNSLFEGKKVETTDGIYKYTFIAKDFGNTDFVANFVYKNSPIFPAFIQPVKISSTSGANPGTNLKFKFNVPESQIKPGQEILFQVVDENFNTIIPSSKVYIDFLQIGKKTGNEDTYNYSFEAGRNYTMRAEANGYAGLEYNFSISSKPLTITISPETGTSDTPFTITASDNATLIIDESTVSNPYSATLLPGNHTIKAVKEGFIDEEKTIEIIEGVQIASSLNKFEKGVRQEFKLNKEANWKVYFQKDSESEWTLLDEKETEGSTSDTIIFTPKTGNYKIVSINPDDNSEKILNNLTTLSSTSGVSWWWYLIGGVLLVGVFFFYKKKSGSPELTGFSSSPFQGEPPQ